MEERARPFEVVENALSHVRVQLAALEDEPMANRTQSFSSLQNAKMRIAMAYGISSLYYMLLRSQGDNPLQHPIKTELDRIKNYVQKAQKAEEIPAQRTTVINEEAAKRVVQHTLQANAQIAATAAVSATQTTNSTHSNSTTIKQTTKTLKTQRNSQGKSSKTNNKRQRKS